MFYIPFIPRICLYICLKMKCYTFWFVHEKIKINLGRNLKNCDLVSHTLSLQVLKCPINSIFTSNRGARIALFLAICCVSAVCAFCFLASFLAILQQPCFFLPLSSPKETCNFVSFLRQTGVERICVELASIEKKEI